MAIENLIEDDRVNKITVIMVSWANYFRVGLLTYRGN